MTSKQEWVVILPDYPGALDKRMAVRSDHLKNIVSKTKEGFWVMGGATLDEPVKEGHSIKINGSIMMAVADSKEQVLEQLKKDVYYEGEVWDKEKIQIFPFKSAIREQLR